MRAPRMKNMQNRLDCEKRIQKVRKGFVFEGPLEEKWSGSPVGAGLARVHSAAARNPSFIKHNSDLWANVVIMCNVEMENRNAALVRSFPALGAGSSQGGLSNVINVVRRHQHWLNAAVLGLVCCFANICLTLYIYAFHYSLPIQPCTELLS